MAKARTASDIDRLVGRQIRLARKMAGMTQTDLGTKVERTFQQIQKYEKGTNRVSAGILFEISQILNIEIMWFFHEETG